MSHEDRSSRVNHAAARPLWQQVADDLRNDIQAGHPPPGSRLPSETELAFQYGVSRVTIRHAISSLSDEGLVEAVHGRGTFTTDELRSTPGT
jgi:DNA-binding GntR family transcriptional regulator